MNNFFENLPPKGQEIDPLANAKRVEKLCELCKNPGRLQCPKCRVTYYCKIDHQKLDWTSCHNKICQLLIPLRTILAPPTSEQERIHRHEQFTYRQKQLSELCQLLSEESLLKKEYNESIPACLQLLRSHICLYGTDSVQLVPAYLLLARASIGLEKFDQAEEYLCQAQWTVLKTESCSLEIKLQLCKNLGCLYFARKNFDFAIKEFSDEVYYAYEIYGVDSYQVSLAYFHLANCFMIKEEEATAMSLYKQVLDIWHKVLTDFFADRKIFATMPKFDETVLSETKDILFSIYKIANSKKNKWMDRLPKISFCLSCIFYFYNDVLKAKEHCEKALDECLTDKEYSKFIREYMQYLKLK